MRNKILISLLFVLGCGNPPPEPAPKMDDNRTGWRSLAKGMSQERVRQLLGEPRKVEKQDRVTCWYYLEGRPLERDANDANRWILPRGALLFSAGAGTLSSWREP
jgi:hypothetical protein